MAFKERGRLAAYKNYRYTLQERIDQANEIHNGKYDYSLINGYKSCKEKVPIICSKHGVFKRSFDEHIHKARGCPLCSQSPRYNKELFVKRSRQIFGDAYIYDNIKDFNSGDIAKNEKVEIICKKHGVFQTTLGNHLSGYGCPKCGLEIRARKRTKPFSEVVANAKKVHGDKYSYVEETYTKSHEEMKIICPIHGEFWQSPIKHINSRHGCPFCKESKLEEAVYILLKENGIEFIRYFKEKWLNAKHLDFYLPKYNIAIECQGEQHFLNSWHVPNEIYERNLYNDNMKFKECCENEVELLYVIPKNMFKTEIFKKYYINRKSYSSNNLGELLKKIQEFDNTSTTN